MLAGIVDSGIPWQPFLLCNYMSWADIQLTKVTLIAEENESITLSQLPVLQVKESDRYHSSPPPPIQGYGGSLQHLHSVSPTPAPRFVALDLSPNLQICFSLITEG